MPLLHVSAALRPKYICLMGAFALVMLADANAAESVTPPGYAEAVSGKFDDALTKLSDAKSLSADEKLFKALCHLGAGDTKTAKTIADELLAAKEAPGETSPFRSIAVDVATDQLSAGSPDFNAALTGKTQLTFVLKGEPAAGDKIRLKGEQSFEVLAQANAKLTVPAGKYEITYQPAVVARRDSSPATENASETASSLIAHPWRRNQAVEIKVPRIDRVAIIAPSDGSAISGENAMIQIQAPPSLELDIGIIHDDVVIWSYKGKGSQAVQFNVDKNATAPLKKGDYVLRVLWKDSAEKQPDTYQSVKSKFKVK